MEITAIRVIIDGDAPPGQRIDLDRPATVVVNQVPAEIALSLEVALRLAIHEWGQVYRVNIRLASPGVGDLGALSTTLAIPSSPDSIAAPDRATVLTTQPVPVALAHLGLYALTVEFAEEVHQGTLTVEERPAA